MATDIVLYYHRRLDTNDVFYIGIGKTKRPYTKSDRNTHWKNVVKKHGLAVEIIAEGLTWEQACELEIEHIARIGRKKDNGTLVNMTDGGDGFHGGTHTEEAKRKIKEACNGMGTRFKKGERASIATEFKKGNVSPPNKGKGKIYGKTIVCKTCGKEYTMKLGSGQYYCSKKCQGLDAEFRQKASMAITPEERQKRRNRMLGKKMSLEAREKMSETKKKQSRVPWNKGLNKYTDERVKKYGETRKLNGGSHGDQNYQ